MASWGQPSRCDLDGWLPFRDTSQVVSGRSGRQPADVCTCTGYGVHDGSLFTPGDRCDGCDLDVVCLLYVNRRRVSAGRCCHNLPCPRTKALAIARRCHALVEGGGEGGEVKHVITALRPRSSDALSCLV